MRDYDLDSFMSGFFKMTLVAAAIGAWVVFPLLFGLMAVDGAKITATKLAVSTAMFSLPCILAVNLVCFLIYKLAFKTRPAELPRGFDVIPTAQEDTPPRQEASSRR